MSKDNNFDQFTIDDILNESYDSGESFSLESILSEYKGSAFIQGEKKTPSDQLDQKVSDILKSVGVNAPKAKIDEVVKEEKKAAPPPAVSAPEKKPEPVKVSEPVIKPAEKAIEQPFERPSEKPAAEKKPVLQIVKEPVKEETEADVKTWTPAPKADPKPINKPNTEDVADFFKNYSENDDRYFESKEFSQKVTDELEKQSDLDFSGSQRNEKEKDFDEFDEEKPSFLDKLLSKFKKDEDEYEEPLGEDDYDEEKKPSFLSGLLSRFTSGDENGDAEYEEEEEEEPDIDQEMARLSQPVPMLTIRSYIAGALVIIMAIFTFIFESDNPLPFGIGFNPVAAEGALLIMQLLVMALGIDILIKGVEDLIHAEPSSDSLVVLSCLFTVVDGIIMLVGKNVPTGLSFSLVSAASVFFAMRGKRSHLVAYIHSLKITKASANPYGVISVTDTSEDPARNVLKKVHGATDGFYKKLVSRDMSEVAYIFAVPILFLLAFLFALISSVGQGRGENFTHSFAIMVAVTAAFPAASAFALPFNYAASGLRKSGSAITGWGGACDVYDTDGALITDEDVFPVGSISLSGIKFFEGVNNQKAVVYGSSLLAASETGLARVFSELLRSQGLTRRAVSSFESYEGGGVGGVIEGERVLCGTGAFMNLMGMRVPDKVNTPNSVFTAVNGHLAAVFTVNYVPANSVSASLKSLLNTKVNVLFAVRDFNVTPAVIQQKFRVSMDGVEYLPTDTSYKLSKISRDDTGGVTALLCREGLSPFAEVITKGRLVKVITELNTLISLGGTAIGLFLMYFLCASDSFGSASSGNAFIFMMAVEICVFLLSQLVRRRS